ncbi:KdsC family phosphatase [Abyssibacter profundi]|uniref:3-deoxy-D-manno-octulosonate 8-phosphate phosphatase KdsC n=1 Tax=Abyssibacter profundi TaxID=2182787 RepID=A0A363UM89_9GAMM|nr:HAD hydrolase family protein [Abyssibacter profundi]PWN56537.1 3-deoxy-D-manno-octulosonate 8-phosphate phosphatase [Abyssibacter profundi]
MSRPNDIQQRAARIKLVVLDIDGVLTDGKLYLAPDGTELKTSSVRDGLGIRLLLDAGIQVAVISGRPSQAYQNRLRSLGVEHIVLSTRVKLPTYEALLETLQLQDDEVACMGDDSPDVPLLERVGLALTVADAHPSAQAAAHWISQYRGGHGAVREACDLILAAQT